jgi:type VI secretion system protein ImpF
VKGEDEQGVVPSVLDRLVDEEPRSTRDVPPTRAESLREFRRAVLRDLDDLLNSRNTSHDLSADFAEAGQSVLTYGLPDFSALTVWSRRDEALASRDHTRLRQGIEAAIRTFEPRLTAVVTSITPPGDNDQSLRVHIDAQLVIEPTPESLSFDIVMPRHAGRYEVKDRQ